MCCHAALRYATVGMHQIVSLSIHFRENPSTFLATFFPPIVEVVFMWNPQWVGTLTNCAIPTWPGGGSCNWQQLDYRIKEVVYLKTRAGRVGSHAGAQLASQCSRHSAWRVSNVIVINKRTSWLRCHLESIMSTVRLTHSVWLDVKREGFYISLFVGAGWGFI